jgi:hypothetical protein
MFSRASVHDWKLFQDDFEISVYQKPTRTSTNIDGKLLQYDSVVEVIRGEVPQVSTFSLLSSATPFPLPLLCDEMRHKGCTMSDNRAAQLSSLLWPP